MTPHDPILFYEVAVIKKIIEDETWLEGERRGCAVSSSDVMVQERVCTIVLRIGQEMRDRFERAPVVAMEPRSGLVAVEAARHEAA